MAMMTDHSSSFRPALLWPQEGGCGVVSASAQAQQTEHLTWRLTLWQHLMDHKITVLFLCEI